MLINKDFTYVVSKTLLGDKLLVGTKHNNSYLEIRSEYFDSFFSLISTIESLDNFSIADIELDPKEKELLTVFIKKGYIGDKVESKSSFNEVKSLITMFFNKDLTNWNFMNVRNIKFFYISYIVFFILFIGYILKNIQSISFSLNFLSFNRIAFFIILFPVILGIHELGHFLVAQIVGVKVKSLTIGWMITNPIVYLDYYGLNLNDTSKKLAVISGGIFSHLLFASLGIFISNNYVSNFYVSLFILCNISMVITNILFFGPSDGYFFLTNLIGIYNLRYRAYKAIKALFANKLNLLSSVDKVAGIILVLLLFISFASLFETILYGCGILNISYSLSVILASVVNIYFCIKLCIKIKKINIKM